MNHNEFDEPAGATPIDISDLKISWVNSQSDLNRVEAENISKAQEKYLLQSIDIPQKWMNMLFLQRIHREMFSSVWGWAGEFRTTQTSIGVKPHCIRHELAQLCDDVRYWCSHPCELTLLEQAIRIHHRLVFIHPFPNGNGRFSRLVADRYLRALKRPFPNWPTDIHRDGTSRSKYIQALQCADSGDYTPLYQFYCSFGAREPSLADLISGPQFGANPSQAHLIATIRAHLRMGGSVNTASKDGLSPLHHAVRKQLSQVVALLAGHGAKIDAVDRSGATPFDMAISNKEFKIAKLLCDHGYPYNPTKHRSLTASKYQDHLEAFNKIYF